MTSTTDTTQHPDVSEISDLTEGLLTPERTGEVREHLNDCPLCADVRASLEEIRGLLGTLPGAPRMPADIAGRIDAALAAEALLNATAPDEAAHVSRETSPAAEPPETPPADRPAGHPRAATGPGRNRRTRRRRTVVLGTAFSAAAVGVSLLLFQSMQTTSSDGVKKEAGVSAAESGAHDYSQSGLEGRVEALLASQPQQPQPRMNKEHEKGPSIDTQSSPTSPLKTPRVEVPACVQQGTGRADSPLAVEQGTYDGDNAYLVVLPHTTDATKVQAYVIDASCVDATDARTGKLLLTDAYPRR
ncbi:hypothetical protein AB0M39_09150 [Streptomyces sp. NPDC051907]|uniref:anti-sigma factor family protein n=1 Tax=Streptomyces sp. NPDC051907 TaxID=3155284 RepID=UPI003430AC89